MEARAGDLLVCGGDVFIAKKDEMGKQTRVVILLFPAQSRARTLHRDALDQGNLRAVAKRTEDAAVRKVVSIEEVFSVEIKRGSVVLEDQVPLNLKAWSDSESAGLPKSIERLHDQNLFLLLSGQDLEPCQMKYG